MFGIHLIDTAVIVLYFCLILYVGVFVGSKKTKSLSEFFIAGGKWGGAVSFLFVFSSALAGNEAVLVSGKAYQVGLSGVWYWWNFLLATPIYYLFSTYFKRARVYNVAEFFEMRYGQKAALFYSVFGGIVSIFFIGIILLAIGKILTGFTTLSLQACIWMIVVIVSAYVFSGGLMSALLTDLIQGALIIIVMFIIMFPVVWNAAGGFQALQALPAETWDFVSAGMPMKSVIALNVSAIVGAIAGPWMLPWIAISKDEKAATFCSWGNFGKRVATLLFTLYGIMFAIFLPNLADPEQAWGIAMSQILPAGVGITGLFICAFFAAGMSSVDTYATTSSSMFIDFFYRRILNKNETMKHYLYVSKIWAVISIIIGAVSTLFIDSIADYVKIWITLLSFIGVPIFFGIWWRKANRRGVWISLSLGMISYLLIMFVFTGNGNVFADRDVALPWGVYIPTGLAFFGMLAGGWLGKSESKVLLDRFYTIISTPIGQENLLLRIGIRLPFMGDAGKVYESDESLDETELTRLYDENAVNKIFGKNSSMEFRCEPTLPWFYKGFFIMILSCVGLVFLTWLLTRLLFIW